MAMSDGVIAEYAAVCGRFSKKKSVPL